MKKVLSKLMTLVLVFSCIMLAGCSSPIYGKKYKYKGEVNISWSSLDESYGKGIEQIITNQIKANNIEWSECKFGDDIIDLSGENFKNGKQVVEYFTNKYKEEVNEKLKDIEITIGSKDEMILTAKRLDDELVYKLKFSTETDGLLFGYGVFDGVEEENYSIWLFETTYDNNLRVMGADYETEITIACKNDVKKVNGEDAEITFSIAACYTKF